jgi:hypothetical protein
VVSIRVESTLIAPVPAGAVFLIQLAGLPIQAQESDSDLAPELELTNPLANIITLPMQ